MKNNLTYLLLFLSTLVFSQGAKTGYGISPIPFHQVKMSDNFWQPRIKAVQEVTVPLTFEKSEATGRIKNFEIAAGATEGKFCTVYAFDDSDVFKAIEGAAYYLQTNKDPKFTTYINDLIQKIGAAQEEDGYLFTWRTIEDINRKKGTWTAADDKNANVKRTASKRWENVDQHSHELYNAGHLYEAAVAWKEATNNDNLLQIAFKNVDLILKEFGSGKIEKAPGHQEIELGLVRLYEYTGDYKYLNLAQFFLEARGYGESYMQNHQKVRDQREAVGHAVRLGYMFSAAADVTAHTGTQAYLSAMNAVWEDIVQKKMYITGGVGSTGSNEGYSQPFELPNFSAYNETCSSIAFVMWNRRMFQLTGDSKYYDVLERTLYNALNAGLALDGGSFFYPNPLEARMNVERRPWFNCACCPPNLSRFYSSLPSYIYAKSRKNVYVNLFASSETTVENINSRGQIIPVKLIQKTGYPYDGKVNITVQPQKPNSFTLRIRIPGWARGDAVPGRLYSFDNKAGQVILKLNGKLVKTKIKNGYAVLKRKWRTNDQVELIMPMPIQKVTANGNIAENNGKVALQRGPLMYCLEGKDQADDRILSTLITDETKFTSTFNSKLLGGVQTIDFKGFLVKDSTKNGDLIPTDFKAIPYFTWANRGKDNMLVWLPIDLTSARPLAAPTIASNSKITASEGYKGTLSGINDQYLPKNSHDKENPFLHWWPKFGTTEWVQYDLAQPTEVGTVRIYWLDDEATEGGCRIPADWHLSYLENGEWRKVYSPDKITITKDGWDTLQFEPVKTSALRLEITGQDGVSVGVQEWEVK